MSDDNSVTIKWCQCGKYAEENGTSMNCRGCGCTIPHAFAREMKKGDAIISKGYEMLQGDDGRNIEQQPPSFHSAMRAAAKQFCTCPHPWSNLATGNCVSCNKPIAVEYKRNVPRQNVEQQNQPHYVEAAKQTLARANQLEWLTLFCTCVTIYTTDNHNCSTVRARELLVNASLSASLMTSGDIECAMAVLVQVHDELLTGEPPTGKG